MNKKSTLGLILFSIGTVVDCLGVLMISSFLGADFLTDSGGNLLFDRRVCMIAGSAVIFFGVVLLLIGYAVVCKYYVPKPKTKEPATSAVKPAKSVSAPYAVPLAARMPNTEKQGVTPKSPLAVTKITYIFCGNCGTRNESEGGFCGGCGQRL